MLNDEKKLSLELYKELGLEVRQLGSETYATNRLMLPPLVIGLLVLYGAVEKFLGGQVAISRDALYLIWFGCALISLIWICNMNRLAQLSHWHLETQRRCEYKLEVIGHRNIAHKDEKSLISEILRHSKIRLIGFGAYFFLLLFNLRYMEFHIEPLKFIEGHILWIAISVSLYLLIWLYYFYYGAPLHSSRATPTKLLAIIKQKFHDIKKWIFQASIMKWVLQYILKPIFQYIIPFIIIILALFALPVLMYVDLQQQPDANDCLVRGLKYFANREYDEAIEDFNTAIALDSNNAGAYFNRGSAYYKTGEFAYAIVDFDMAIALDPQNRSARDLRNKAQRELENLDKQ